MTVITHIPRAIATVRYTDYSMGELIRARSFRVMAPATATDKELYNIARNAVLEDPSLTSVRVHRITLQMETTS